MEAVKGYDYLICLSLETTRTQDDYRDLIESQKERMIDRDALMKDPKFPNIIEINWISYCVAEQKPEKEPNVHFVKPTNMEHLNSKTVELTGVTQEDIEHAESLESVLTKFNNFVFNSFVLKNKSYCIITFGHWELAYQLFIEMSQKKINFSKIDLSTSADLGHHFYFVFDLRKEFLKDFPSHVGSIHKIDQLLDALKLKRNVDAIKTTKSCTQMICNIVRIVHRMIKQGHQFTDPLDIKSVGDESLENPEVVPIAQKSEEIKIEPVQVYQPEVNIESKPEVEPEVKPQIIYEAKQEIFEAQKVDPPVEINQISPKVEQKVPVYEETKLPEYEESKLSPDKQVGISMDIPPIADEYQPYIDYNQHQPSINEYVPPPYNGQGYYEDRRRERVSYYDQMPRGPSNRDRSPTSQMRGYSEENTIKYVRARNLPSNCDKSGIIEFFSSIPIAYANIALVYDQTGRFCQEAILALNNLNDQIEAVYQSGRYIFNYQVFVEEAAPAEWEHAQQTQKVFFNRDERILVRMRGLPYTIKKEEVLAFFAGYDVVPDSVIIGEMGNGKKTGEGVILFKSEEEAQRAVNDKNGSSIGRRWIELYLHPYSHFHNFFQAQHHEEFVYLNKFITEENKFRSLRLRGLPFNVSKKEILNFFKEFPLSDSDVIFEIKEGRATGRALVFMMDPITAVRAVQRLDKEYIGNRYIELDQVSNLPHEF